MSTRFNPAIDATAESLVLVNGDWRVEIHLRRDDDEDLTTLLAFAGRERQPERESRQGPYQSMEQAIGAKRAIATRLMQSGYRLESSDYPIWSIHAQRSIRGIREHRAESRVNYAFDPSDVFLDW